MTFVKICEETPPLSFSCSSCSSTKICSLQHNLLFSSTDQLSATLVYPLEVLSALHWHTHHNRTHLLSFLLSLFLLHRMILTSSFSLHSKISTQSLKRVPEKSINFVFLFLTVLPFSIWVRILATLWEMVGWLWFWGKRGKKGYIKMQIHAIANNHVTFVVIILQLFLTSFLTHKILISKTVIWIYDHYTPSMILFFLDFLLPFNNPTKKEITFEYLHAGICKNRMNWSAFLYNG